MPSPEFEDIDECIGSIGQAGVTGPCAGPGEKASDEAPLLEGVLRRKKALNDENSDDGDGDGLLLSDSLAATGLINLLG